MKKKLDLLLFTLFFVFNFYSLQAQIHFHVPNPLKPWQPPVDLPKPPVNIPKPPSSPSEIKETISASTNTIKKTAKVLVDVSNPKNQIIELRKSATIPGKILIKTTEAIAILKAPMQEYVDKHMGNLGAVIFDLGNFMESYTNNFASSTTNYANTIIEGGDIVDILGVPLAAAIHEARDRYNAKAIPIPDDVKNELLKKGFDQETLSRARYAVGTIEIALPNFINKSVQYFSNSNNAVTVDDIIVFSTDPGTLYAQNCIWWAHEMTHIRQYKDMGVEKFAYSYSKDVLAGKSYVNIALEKEAIANASLITQGSCNAPIYPNLQSISDLKKKNPISIRGAYFTSVLKHKESYIAQFHMDYKPGTSSMFLITDSGRIIPVNPLTGRVSNITQANHPQPPNVKNYEWVFVLPDTKLNYGVNKDGKIEKIN